MIWLVMTRRLPSFDAAWLPAHYAFLDGLRAEGRLLLSGPFDDASGGAYLLAAASREEALAIAARDPLGEHACSDVQVTGWSAKGPLLPEAAA